jgi:hypothetical protein
VAGALGVRTVIVAALVAVLPLPAALWRWSRRSATTAVTSEARRPANSRP